MKPARLVPSVFRNLRSPEQLRRFGTSRPWAAGALAVLLLLLFTMPETGWLGVDRPTMTGILLVAIFAYAWNPVGGVLGELSIAHLVSWGAGSYACVLAVNADWQVVPAMAVAVAIGAVLAVAVVVFASMAKLDGLYLMGFGLVLVFLSAAVVAQWPWLGGTAGLPAESLPLSPDQIYYVAVALTGVLIAINVVLLTSRRGLAWLALRDDAERVASTGWSPHAERGFAYVLSGALCGLGGALQALSIGFVSPDTGLTLHLIIVPLLAVYVGGPGTIWGPLLGVALLEGLSTAATGDSASPDTAETIALVQYLVALAIVAVTMSSTRGARGTWIQAGSDPRPRAAGASASAPPSAANADRGRGRKAAPPMAAEGVQKSFGGLRVLEDVSFVVRAGEIVGLVGPNGAGKSTLCNIVAGTVRPDAGRIRLGGTDVTAWPAYRRIRHGLGRTFQVPRVFPSLSLAENLEVSHSRVREDAAAASLRGLGVRDPGRNANTASLLERRMVEIGRLIATPPRWALLDEPLAGLSADEHDVILEQVSRLAATGTCVLLVEHLIPAIAPIVDRMNVLHGGRMVADGPPEEVLRDPVVIDAYLGQPIDLAQAAI